MMRLRQDTLISENTTEILAIIIVRLSLKEVSCDETSNQFLILRTGVCVHQRQHDHETGQ